MDPSHLWFPEIYREDHSTGTSLSLPDARFEPPRPANREPPPAPVVVFQRHLGAVGHEAPLETSVLQGVVSGGPTG